MWRWVWDGFSAVSSWWWLPACFHDLPMYMSWFWAESWEAACPKLCCCPYWYGFEGSTRLAQEVLHRTSLQSGSVQFMNSSCLARGSSSWQLLLTRPTRTFWGTLRTRVAALDPFPMSPTAGGQRLTMGSSLHASVLQVYIERTRST